VKQNIKFQNTTKIESQNSFPIKKRNKEQKENKKNNKKTEEEETHTNVHRDVMKTSRKFLILCREK
jgi:hypothetical protein